MNPIYKFTINRGNINQLDPKPKVEGGALNVADGTIVSDANFNTYDYIEVVGGETYHLITENGGIYGIPYVCLYDKDGGYLSGRTGVGYVTIDDDAKYVRVSIPSATDASTISFCLESVSTFDAYIPPRVYPIYGDDLVKEFEKVSDEQCFRENLKGDLTFVKDDYEWIMARPFDYKFEISLFISYDGGEFWSRYWDGFFYKTDCKFDEDDENVVVTPSSRDRYSDLLAGLEKEYDLIRLAPEISHIKVDKRPMLQFYSGYPTGHVVGCYLSGMWWEQECAEPDSYTTLAQQGWRLVFNKVIAIFSQGTGTPSVPRSMSMDVPLVWPLDFTMTGGGYELVCTHIGTNSFDYDLREENTHVALFHGHADTNTPDFVVRLNAVSGTSATGYVDVDARLFQIWCRIVCDKETATTIAIPSDDLVGDMRNYRFIEPLAEGVTPPLDDAIAYSDRMSEFPTEWGLYQPDEYYLPPEDGANNQFIPIIRESWGAISMWVDSSQIPASLDENYRASFVLREAYPIASVISVLLGQIAPQLHHEATIQYSRFLYGESDPLSFSTHNIFITPKSNILTANYDQPAQQGKITLRRVLDMLRDCYRCYWYVDESNRFRIEHIEFFRRGGKYATYPGPEIGIDLTTELVPRNGKPWSYSTSKYVFEKPAMSARYQFGWMDDVTRGFEGEPIDIISGYVEKGKIENVEVSSFTSDVDYMLCNPNACSKDGFALLSAVLKLNASDVEFEQGMLRVFVGEPFESCKQSSSKQIRTANLIPIVNSSIFVQSFGTGLNYAIHEYDSSKCLLRSSGAKTGNNTITFLDATRYIAIVVLRADNTDISPDIVSTFTNTISGIGPFVLPYENIGGGLLQNGQVAWPYLQIYYVWDMPAKYYKIGNVTYQASGVKRLKKQELSFPLLRDAEVQKLVKTEIGDGEIEKISIYLSSRNAKVTLKYDTE